MLFKTNYLNVVLMDHSQPDSLCFRKNSNILYIFFLARSMKHNSLVNYHPGRWPESTNTKREKEFFKWRKRAEHYLTEEANKSHLSPIFTDISLALHCHMTKTKASQPNEEWLRSIGPGGTWHEALGGLSSCCLLIRENIKRIWISTTCSFYFLNELDPVVSSVL